MLCGYCWTLGDVNLWVPALQIMDLSIPLPLLKELLKSDLPMISWWHFHFWLVWNHHFSSRKTHRTSLPWRSARTWATWATSEKWWQRAGTRWGPHFGWFGPWLVGGLEPWNFMTFHIYWEYLGIIILTDFHIFERGWNETTNQMKIQQQNPSKNQWFQNDPRTSRNTCSN